MRTRMLIPILASISAVAACSAMYKDEPGVRGRTGGSSGGTGGVGGSGANDGGAGGAAGSGSGGAGGNGGSGGASGSGGAGGAAGSGSGGAGGVGGVGGVGGGGTGGGGIPGPNTPVNVIITADNAYGFGFGSLDKLENYFGGVENKLQEDIFSCPVGVGPSGPGFGPESYIVPAESANKGNYLYIIGYADKLTTQGVIAKFYRVNATPVYTGDGNWEVCATGVDYDPGAGGPTRAVIDQQIAICNAGTGSLSTTSAGWVGTTETPMGKVVFGEDNSTTRDPKIPTPGNEFLIACDIEPSAKWMWYEWVPNRTTGSPFMWPGGTTNITKDFLIFRLGAEFIPEPN